MKYKKDGQFKTQDQTIELVGGLKPNNTVVPLPVDTNGLLALTATGTPEISLSSSNQPVKGFSTATISTVSLDTSSVTVLASNSNRKSVILFCPDTAYIRLGSGIDVFGPNGFHFVLSANQAKTLEFPCYTGIITATLFSGTSTLRVTELTQ